MSSSPSICLGNAERLAEIDRPLRMLFVYADCGAGHLASALAVKGELEERYGRQVKVELHDPTADTSFNLLRRIPRGYGPIIRWIPSVWGRIYDKANTEHGYDVVSGWFRSVFVKTITEKVEQFRPDIVVTFHAFITAPTRVATSACPLAVVVTDLGGIHRSWLQEEVDLIALPSASSIMAAKSFGLGEEVLTRTGLPIARAFTDGPPTAAGRKRLRNHLGLDDRFSVLLMGGGEGVGPLRQQARAVLQANPDAVCVVICGRNKSLLRRVGRLAKRHPGRVIGLGFVDNVAEWMKAVDVVATKAGPGTIAEGLASGAALVLTGALPGQEQGNADHVVRHGAAVAVNTAGELAAVVEQLSHEPQRVAALRSAAVVHAEPGATSSIAEEVVSLALDRLPVERIDLHTAAHPRSRISATVR